MILSWLLWRDILIYRLVIKEAQLFANDNYRGFAKDVFNGAISSGIALGKDNMPS